MDLDSMDSNRVLIIWLFYGNQLIAEMKGIQKQWHSFYVVLLGDSSVSIKHLVVNKKFSIVVGIVLLSAAYYFLAVV